MPPAALRPELLYSVRSLGAGRRALFRFVYLPATLPAALTALRVSIGTAIAVLFFAESFATTSGLGYYIIVESWGRLAYPEMYAGVMAMSLLGLLLYLIVDRLERRLCALVGTAGSSAEDRDRGLSREHGRRPKGRAAPPERETVVRPSDVHRHRPAL